MTRMLAILAATSCLATPAGAASIVNGSLTGSTDIDDVPTGWSALNFSPDTNDLNGPGGAGGFFDYISAPPVASSDGGTWVGLTFGCCGSSFESFGQQINDFVLGQTYTLGWEQFNSGADYNSGISGANAFAVSLDGAVVGAGATSALGDGWTATSVTFQATSTSHLLSFALADSTPAYMNIDGIAFDSMTAIPLPASAWLLVGGLGGIAAMRRRRG